MTKHTVINSGFYGCAIQPHIKCKMDIKNKELISKIVDLKGLDKKVKKTFLEEKEINKIIRKHDPNQTFFLSAIESCKKRKIDNDRKKVFKKCGVSRKKPQYLNLIFEKGYNFNEKMEKMNNKEISKTLLYLCHGLNFMLYELGLTLYDIHSGNLLFAKKGDYFHPVFIDFSPDYISKITPQNFINYVLNNKSRFEYKNYIDIYTLIYDFVANWYKKPKITKKHSKYYIQLYSYFMLNIFKEDKRNKTFDIFLEKFLLETIGSSFKTSKHFKNNKYLKNITQDNVLKRYDLDTLIKKMTKDLKVKSLEDLYIK
jgi:hypothetical protein